MPKPQTTATVWRERIAAYEREFKEWEQRVHKIIRKYRDEKRQGSNSDNAQSRFPILWSNVQTLIPATFSRLPQPDVSRRFRDQDPVGRVAALLLERGLEYEIQHYPDYRETLKEDIQDRFLGGRGTAWQRYEPHMLAAQQGLPTDGVEASEDTDEPDEQLDYECAPVDYVHWKDFGHTVARTWEEVTAVWRHIYMTREALVERFGAEAGEKIPLDSRPDNLDNDVMKEAEYSRAKITEIWDKTSMQVVWMGKSGKPLDTRAVGDGEGEAPKFEGFWPCPRPLYATLTNDSLIPVPDFTLYQDQAATLDVLSSRISGLVDALQVKGVYDGSIPALARIFTEGTNGSLVAVKNWAAFAEKNGLAGAIDLVDLAPIAAALKESYLAMEQVKGQVHEITGISDIIRGQSEASETATAQRLKGQYASLRLKAYQEEVAYFATGLLQLKAQVICSRFSEQTIMLIGGAKQLSPEDQQIVPRAIELLKQGPMRDFRIGIAADTLVQLDEQAEKEGATELLTAVGGYLEKLLPIAQSSPLAAEIGVELLKFGLARFKVGKTIEGTIDSALDKLKQAAAQPQPPKPDPEMAKVQAQQASDQARLQADQQKVAAELQARQQEAQFTAHLEQQKAQMADAREAHKLEMEMQLGQFKAQLEATLAREEIASKERIAQLQADTTIATAQLSATTTMKTTAMSANAKAAEKGEGVTEMDGEGTAKPTSALKELIDAMNENGAKQAEMHTQALQAATGPRKTKARKDPMTGEWLIESLQ